MSKLKSLQKLENLVWKWVEPKTSRDRPKRITFYMINEMRSVYQDLKHGLKGKFISSDLVPYLTKCGFKIDGPERYENNRLVFGYVAYL